MSRPQRTVLIVDDSAEDRELYRRYLSLDRDYSYTIWETELGQEGLELWQQQQPDLILLDYRLPDLDGLEFLTTLQTQQSFLPIIMVTGRGNEALAVRAIKAGAQDYLVKENISPESLLLAVNGAIEAVQLRRQLQQHIERERLISQISQQIHQSLNLNQILQTAVAEIRQFLQTDRVIVFRLLSDGNGTIVAESVKAKWQPLLHSNIYDPCLAENNFRRDRSESEIVTYDSLFNENYVERYRRGLVTAKSDIYDGSIDPCHVELLAQFQVRANLVVPILQEDQLWGLLIAHHCNAPRQWQPLEIDLLKELSTHLGIALKQAELYQQARQELAERQRTQEVLRQSEERLRLGMQVAGFALAKIDYAANTVELSPQAATLYGLPVDELVVPRERIHATFHPEERAELDRLIAQVLDPTGSGWFSREHRVVWVNGEVRWLSVRKQVFFDRSGESPKPTHAILVALDVTERKQAEILLQQSQEKLKFALEASRMGTWDWNIQTGWIEWSDNLESLFGLEAGEFNNSYEMFVSRVHPEDRERVLAAIDRCVETGEDYDIEFRVVYPNGNIRWALSRGKVFYDRSGQAIRMAGNDIDITERKQVETALKQSEERFRQLAENIDAVFWIKEVPENRVSYVSLAYERLWGFNPQKLYQKQQVWSDYIYPEERESIDKAFREKALLGQFDEEYRIVLADGSIRWVRDRCFPLQNEAGEIYRFAGITEDITDRKRSEQARKESEERLQMAIEASGSGLWDWNIVTNEDYLSPRWLEMLGYNLGELPEHYNTWEQLIHPEDRAWVLELLNAHLQDDSVPYKFEYRMLIKSGGWKWIANYGKVVRRDERGNPLRMAGIHHDISDRKQAEEELRQSEERYRYLAEAIPQLVWTCDARGNCDYVNQQLCDYTGLSLDRAVGQGWLEAVHPDDRQLSQALWINAVCQGTYYRHEYRFRQASDGSYRWHLILGLPVKDSQGKVLKWFGTCTDINEQKQLEIERARLLDLEQTARAEAERANRIKDEFLAILSHELRSPLNPILGWVQLLQTQKFDPTRIAQGLATIERNAKLQTQLIDDLLDVAKILRGKLSLNALPLNLVFVIEAALDTVRTAAVAKSILLYPTLANIGQVSADPTRLQQVIWNLLSNAIKFTPEGGRVDIRLEKVDHSAQITVSDTGKGINPDFLPHIFEYFRQEDVSITRKHGGLGLGLAIVRHLVEAHGGTISASSPGQGRGATFTVNLPLLNVESETEETNDLLDGESDLSGIRVLCIDDEPDTLELLGILLTEYGASVMTVASAAEVLTALESFQPDILVSDIGMPELDGYTLLQQVRSLPPERGGQILAIALTAYAGEIDQQRALSVGFQKHLTKPIEPNRLTQAVLALVKTSHTNEAT